MNTGSCSTVRPANCALPTLGFYARLASGSRQRIKARADRDPVLDSGLPTGRLEYIDISADRRRVIGDTLREGRLNEHAAVAYSFKG